MHKKKSGGTKPVLNASDFTFEYYHDSRLDSEEGFTVGGSGRLLFARSKKSDEKYIVKYEGEKVLINEYVCCWLADKLNVPAPHASFFRKNALFGGRNAVAIEYLNIGKGKLASKTQRKHYIKAYLFNHIIKNGDAEQIYLWPRVVTLDFGASDLFNEYTLLFSMDSEQAENDTDKNEIFKQWNNHYKTVFWQSAQPKNLMHWFKEYETIHKFDEEEIESAIKEMTAMAKTIKKEDVRNLNKELKKVARRFVANEVTDRINAIIDGLCERQPKTRKENLA